MTDSITLTKEQFDSWKHGPNGASNLSFDSLKAFVERKERREFYIVEDNDGAREQFDYPPSTMMSTSKLFYVKEVLPNDIGPFTPQEAREWILRGMQDLPNTVFDGVGNALFNKYCKALGLGE